MRISIASRSILLVTGLGLAPGAAAAGDFSKVHKRADPLPVPQTRDGLTAGPRPPSALGAAQSNVFFLNYDGVSIQFTGQGGIL